MTIETHGATGRSRPGERGFTLLEAVIAAGLIAGALAGLAQMFGASIAANVAARTRSTAAVLAAQKMEQLREAAWTADVAGADYVDWSGEVVAGGAAPGAAWVRRWSATPLAASPEVLALQVTVATRLANETERTVARLVTLRGQKAP